MRIKPSKRLVRLSGGLIVTTCLLLLLVSLITSPATTQQGVGPSRDDGIDSHSPQLRDNITVVTTQGFYLGNHPGARNVAEIIAFSGTGTTIYRNSSHQVYYDVDPVPKTKETVEYVAADRVAADKCGSGDRCSRNVVQRVNLSTGEVTTVYASVTPKFDGGRWHDVDRINETHLVIADIVYDRVVMVDVRTGSTVWQWNASDRFSASAGGDQADWTHINDVEILDDGRVMASIRNMDQVVFLEPSEGVEDEWTLGSDEDHETLHEPHNPDFIPERQGGPAVVLADSENNRIIEYQRRTGEWTRAWSWRDSVLQWPRDADRLPNGHTLIVDSHGDRVFEVGSNGSIVWGVSVGRPYDAERLGSGPESQSGFAAGTSPTCASGSPCGSPPLGKQGAAEQSGTIVKFKDAIPPVFVNSLLFIAPRWVQFTDLVVGGILVVTTVVWGVLELVWSRYTVVGIVS